MQKVLSDPMQIGIALRNDHGIDHPFLFFEPNDTYIFDENSYGYTFQQYQYSEGFLTVYKEANVIWRDHSRYQKFLRGALPNYTPTRSILCAFIHAHPTNNVESYYNAELLNGDRSAFHNGCKIKTAHALGFENWGEFKKEHDPTQIKAITITNATK